MNTRRRILAILTLVVMVVSMLTVFAFAASLATVGMVIYVGSRARGKLCS